MSLQFDENKQAKTLRFLEMVDAECRRWGGKHLLTAGEYLDIVNRMYAIVYDVQDAGSERPASV